MSNEHNDVWLEAADQNFQEALAEMNIPLAKAIISDVQEAGFLDEGREMNNQLKAATRKEEAYE